MDNDNGETPPDDLAKMDQLGAFLGDTMPPIWARMYTRCIELNFTEDQAFKLVQTYILAQCPNGIRGTDGQ